MLEGDLLSPRGGRWGCPRFTPGGLIPSNTVGILRLDAFPARSAHFSRIADLMDGSQTAKQLGILGFSRTYDFVFTRFFTLVELSLPLSNVEHSLQKTFSTPLTPKQLRYTLFPA